MANVEILGFPPSTFVRAARMACEEKGVPYDFKPVPPHSPDVLAIHPFGKIPALRHGDFELFESKAIADYIDRTFDGPALFPSDPRERARAEQWVSIVNTVMDPVMIRTYLFSYFFPKTADGSTRSRGDRRRLAGRCAQQIDILDKAVAPTGYLAGDQLHASPTSTLMVILYLR